MKTNMGSADRVIRAIAAIAVIVLYATNIISGLVAILLLVVATIFILTSMISFCPLYALLGLSTSKKNSGESAEKV